MRAARFRLVLALLALPLAAPPAGARKIEIEDPYGLTAYIPAGTSSAAKRWLMDEAARSNRHLMRVELPFEELEPEPGKFTDYLEETVAMAGQRGITLIGVLRGTAPWIADARSRDLRRGPVAADRYGDYREHCKELAERYPLIRYWEVWSGADDPRRVLGTPADFARLLDAAYKGIKSGDRKARVLLPAPSQPAEVAFAPGSFLDQVLNDRDHPGRKRFDAAALRLRLPVEELAGAVATTRAYLDSLRRKDARIWVVDVGFPAAPAAQKLIDRSFAKGEPGQAGYYDNALPRLLSAGAQVALVPLNDLPWSDPRCSKAPFPLSACSEGLVTFGDPGSLKGSRERVALALISGLR